jgi:hypothetical protein
MNKVFFLFIVCFLCFGNANATNIRGRLLRTTQQGPIPLAGVRVDLMIWNGQVWVNSSFAITGGDGFYYFLNFPPGGTFCIKVFDRFYPPRPMVIMDYQPPFYEDVPAIFT